MPQSNNILITTEYRRPTHTDLYLPWNSHHNLAAKFRVISTLTHRERTVSYYPQLLKGKDNHLKQALKKCQYPVWALNMTNIKSSRHNIGSNNISNNTACNNNKAHTVVPYIKGLGESCKTHLQKTWNSHAL